MDSFAKYEQTLKELSAESGEMAWSSGTLTSFILILILIGATIVFRIFVPFANMLVMLLIFAVEGIALFIPYAIYHHKAAVYLKERCLELEFDHPGIYEAYEDWLKKARDKAGTSIGIN